MSVQLDWEVESEQGVEQVGEDPSVIAARQRKARRIRRVLTALGALTGLT